MIWNFIDTGYNTGRFNMDFDRNLVSNAIQDESTLRFYRWSPYCISLGANQSFNSINFDKARKNNIDVVKRPTGGRAILHSEELTYSVIHPLTVTNTPKKLYQEINLTLKKGLTLYSEIFRDIELENEQPHFPTLYKKEKSNLCFAISAKNELKFNGKKLVGSAQRKMGDYILQHGSILCGDYHKNIIHYLTSSSSGIEEIRKEIDETTTDIKSILNEDVDYNRLIESLKTGFEEHFLIKFNNIECMLV